MAFSAASKVMGEAQKKDKEGKEDMKAMGSRVAALETSPNKGVMEKVLQEGKRAEADQALLAMVKCELGLQEKRLKAIEKEEPRKAPNEVRRTERPMGEEIDARLEEVQRGEGRIAHLEMKVESIQHERAKEAEGPDGWKADAEVLREAWGDLTHRMQAVERWQQETTLAAETGAKDRAEIDKETGKELGVQDQERRCMMVRLERLEREDAKRREGEPSHRDLEKELKGMKAVISGLLKEGNDAKARIKALQEADLGKDQSIADLYDLLKYRDIERAAQQERARKRLQEEEAKVSPRDGSLGTSLVSSADLPQEEWAVLEERRGKEDEKLAREIALEDSAKGNKEEKKDKKKDKEEKKDKKEKEEG